MNPDELTTLDDDEACFVIPVPPNNEDDDEDTELVFNIVPVEEGLAILGQS
jgi:hypothetical protein